MLRILLSTVLLLVASPAGVVAESRKVPSSTRVFKTRDGHQGIKVILKNKAYRSKAKGAVFVSNPDGSVVVVRSIDLVNIPVKASLYRALGNLYIVTTDTWYKPGYEHALVVYSPAKVVADFHLKDLLTKAEIEQHYKHETATMFSRMWTENAKFDLVETKRGIKSTLRITLKWGKEIQVDLQTGKLVHDGNNSNVFREPGKGKARAVAEESVNRGQNAGYMYGPVKDGLAASLMCLRSRFKVGEPIPVNYGLVHVGKGLHVETDLDKITENARRRIRVWWFMMGPGYPGDLTWFEITGPDGKNVPYRGGTGDPPSNPPLEDFSVVLNHRQYVGRVYPDVSGRETLREDFDLTKPGTYTLQWNYKPWFKGGPWVGELTSNKVQFEVVK